MDTVLQKAQFEGRWATAQRWVRELRQKLQARPEKKLRMTETLSLGDRRFLAIVEFDRQKFLIGGTNNSVSLLAELRNGPLAPTALRPGAESPAEDLWP